MGEVAGSVVYLKYVIVLEPSLHEGEHLPRRFHHNDVIFEGTLEGARLQADLLLQMNLLRGGTAEAVIFELNPILRRRASTDIKLSELSIQPFESRIWGGDE